MNSVCIVGCGYVGRRLARDYLDRGIAVRGIVRTPGSRDTLVSEGIYPVVADLDCPGTAKDLCIESPACFYLAPPPPQGEQDPRIRHFLDGLCDQPLPERILYVSTSGVYGDCKGAWVDETQALRPATLRARRRADAESALHDWSQHVGKSVVILRVPGIYGPGRLPLERLRRQHPVLREADAPFTNRIHVDDLVAACIAAMERGCPGAAYNVSDGHPSSMTDYFNRIADRAGLPRPPAVSRAEAQTALSPGMLSFLSESKRLVNRRMLSELGVVLKYPSLDAGLEACFREENPPD